MIINDMISRSGLEQTIRAYADQTHYNGHTELANGILKTLTIIEAAPPFGMQPADQKKPLTWEEIPDHKLVFMELRGLDKPIPSILRQTMDNQAWYTMESGCVFTFDMDELGKRWRPWAIEPTDEERSAAEWM